MLKKARARVAEEENKDEAPAGGESSRNIWLAGLGALSRAQAEGMRMFESLVKQGEALESRTRQVAADTAAAARGAATAKVKEVKEGVGGTWDKLEQVFEARVARALAKLGVHTHNDVQKLTERVDALSEAVNDLIKASGGAVKARGGRAPAKKQAKTARKTGKRTKPAA